MCERKDGHCTLTIHTAIVRIDRCSERVSPKDKAQEGGEVAQNLSTIRFNASLIRGTFQFTKKRAVPARMRGDREHGVHHLLGSLLDLFLRPTHRLFPSRSSPLRGAKVIRFEINALKSPRPVEPPANRTARVNAPLTTKE